MKDPGTIKLSPLDLQAPSDVEIVFRFTEPESGSRRRQPEVIAEFTDIEKARMFAAELRRRRHKFNWLTYWRKDGRHMNKWATLMRDKRRSFRVSVPYVQGISDEMVKVFLQQAILGAPDVPAPYKADKALRISTDTDANRAELAGCSMMLFPVPVEHIVVVSEMSLEEKAKIIQHYIEET